MPLILQKKAKKGKNPKTSFSKEKIEKIRKEFNELRYKFSKLKIKEIRKNLYEIENEKNLSESKIKEIEKNLTELEKNLSKISREWKIQLTMAIHFISSKDSDETRNMHTKSNNVTIMIGSETDEIIKNLFESFLQKISRMVRRINERK